MTEDLPSEPESDLGRFPVFVDDTGRRRRWVRWVGWGIGVLAASYIALFALSLASSPTLLPLSIPGIGRLLPNAGAPDIGVPGQGRRHVSTIVATSTPAPAVGTPGAGPVTTPTPAHRPSTLPTPTTRPSSRPTAIPSATTTAKPTARGSPTARPTSQGTGKPTARPTSGQGHSPTAHPHQSRP
jgi:hypothetical protein